MLPVLGDSRLYLCVALALNQGLEPLFRSRSVLGEPFLNLRHLLDFFRFGLLRLLFLPFLKFLCLGVRGLKGCEDGFVKHVLEALLGPR